LCAAKKFQHPPIRAREAKKKKIMGLVNLLKALGKAPKEKKGKTGKKANGAAGNSNDMSNYQKDGPIATSEGGQIRSKRESL